MDDNLLAKLCFFLFLAGSYCCECAEMQGCISVDCQKVDVLKSCKLIAQQLIENKYARTWEESPSNVTTTWHNRTLSHFTSPRKKIGTRVTDNLQEQKYQTWKCSCKSLPV